MEDRIKALENWRHQHITNSKERLGHNQERFLALEHDLKEIQSSEGMNGHVYNLEDRIKTLEDIIAKHFKKDEGKPNPNQKIKINKQVWEDIKREVAEATGYCQCTIKGHHTFGELHRLIKKAEPGWNDKR